MAMTSNLFDSLCETGFGPITISKTDDPLRYEASIAGDRVAISVDGPAIRLAATSPARWPSGPPDQIASRVRFSLQGLLLGRADLAELDASENGNEVSAQLWLDAGTTTAGTLAAAVQGVRLLARAGALMLDSVEEEMRAEEAWIASRPSPVPLPDVPVAPASEPAVAAAPVTSPEPPAARPTWVYVEEPAPIYHLDGSQTVVGSAQPGRWYRLERQEDRWAHVTDPESGMTGWVAANAIRRQGT